MAETVEVPGAGKFKKTYVYAGVAVVGVLAVMYYRNHKASSSAATTAAPVASNDPYPSDGSVGNASDPNSIDPATGITYGDEGSSALPGSLLGTGFGGGGNTNTPNSGPGTFTDNASWAQYAINYLVTNSNADAGAVTTALGLYINGQAVNDGEHNIILQAIGIAGSPPVAGPGNYPPSIRLSGNPPPKPPPPKPKPKPGSKPSTPTGVHVIHVTSNTVTVGWNRVTGASKYEVHLTYQGRATHTITTTGTSATITGLSPNHTYTIHVAASNSAGTSAETNGPTAHTS